MPQTAPATATAQPPLILVIEDNRSIADIYVTVLTAAGYRTAMAETARAGMTKLRESRPDMVLLDLNLPDAPGTAVLKAIRSDNDLAVTPVIVLTASNRVEDLLSAVQAGASDCAVKPCQPAALLYKVAHQLRRSGVRPPTA